MRINFELTGEESRNELNALAALIAALGGRVVSVVNELHGELTTNQRLSVHQLPPASAPLATPVPSDGANGASEEAAPSPSAPTSDERDARGLPWDERIHSGGDNRKNADGTWRKRRGVADDLVAQVEAELRGNAPSVPADTAPPVPAATSAAEPPAPPPPPAPTADAAAAPTVETPPAPPPAASAVRSERFTSMAEFVTYVNRFGKKYDELAAMALQFGKPSFAEVTKDPAVWDAFCLANGWVD
jgi:hypothetical protein